jgi:hypothetical protein
MRNPTKPPAFNRGPCALDLVQLHMPFAFALAAGSWVQWHVLLG